MALETVAQVLRSGRTVHIGLTERGSVCGRAACPYYLEQASLYDQPQGYCGLAGGRVPDNEQCISWALDLAEVASALQVRPIQQPGLPGMEDRAASQCTRREPVRSVVAAAPPGAWVKLDDGVATHPKFTLAGPAAFALWVAGLGYCNRYSTDGLIPKGMVRSLLPSLREKDAQRAAEKLCSNAVRPGGQASWIDEGEYYRVHDYEAFQPSRLKVESDREDARLRMERLRTGRRRSQDVRANTWRTDADSSSAPYPYPYPPFDERHLGGEDLGGRTPPPLDDREHYSQVLAERFVQVRGGTSRTARFTDLGEAGKWFDAAIPLDVALEVVERLARRRKESGIKDPISSLRYFREAADAATEDLRELMAPGYRDEPPPAVDVQSRLAVLVESLPDAFVLTFAERIRNLSGSIDAVERALEDLDADLCDSAFGSVAPEVRASIAERVEITVGILRQRQPDHSLTATRARLIRQVTREQLGLPHLSLFASEFDR